nr:hypothetical protein CFP56_44352 [Quercus suber]
MKHPHHLTVTLHSTADKCAQPVREYRNPYAGNKASHSGLLCSQVIAVKPGTKFGLQLTIGRRFNKFTSKGVRVLVVAPDRPNHVTVRQWWISIVGNTGEKIYDFDHGEKGLAGSGREFVMPKPVGMSSFRFGFPRLDR